jgi:hypothetical protein
MQPLKTSNKSSKVGRGCLLAFGIAWTLFSLLLTLAIGAFGLIFLAIGLVIIGVGLAPVLAGMKVPPPELSISQQAARVGETFTVAYRQTFKKPVTVTRITLEWVFRETATYRRGTDTITDTHENRLDGVQHPSQTFAAGDVFTEERRFTVPTNGIHTFVSSNNTLRYFVRLRVELPGWPDVREEHEIRVLPQHIEEAQNPTTGAPAAPALEGTV